MEKTIPIHDFYEEDIYAVPVRHISLQPREGYEEAQPHRHNYFEIFFFAKGGGDHLIDFREYPIGDYTVHFIYPGQVHLLRRHPSSHGCVIHITEDTFYGLNSSKNLIIQGVATLTVSEIQYGELGVILNQLLYEYNRNKINAEMLKGYLQLLIIRCQEFYDAGSKKNNIALPDLFIRFRDLVDAEFCRQKSPGWYALQLDMEDRSLNNICRSVTGSTTGEYIKSRILLEAKRLIYNSQWNIKEISYYLGFEDPSYFNRFFKKNMGITAGDFRHRSSLL